MVEIVATICVTDRVHSRFGIVSAERSVVVGTADKGTARASAHCLRGCRKLSTILGPIGVLARPCLPTDGQPPGNPRIHHK